MVGGVLGEVVVNLAVLEFRQELAQIRHQHMEVLSVLDLQVKLVTCKHVKIPGARLVPTIAGMEDVVEREVFVRMFVALVATAVEKGTVIVLTKHSKLLQAVVTCA